MLKITHKIVLRITMVNQYGILISEWMEGHLPHACIYSFKNHFATTVLEPVVDWRTSSDNWFWGVAFCHGVQRELLASGRSRLKSTAILYPYSQIQSYQRQKSKQEPRVLPRASFGIEGIKNYNPKAATTAWKQSFQWLTYVLEEQVSSY